MVGSGVSKLVRLRRRALGAVSLSAICLALAAPAHAAPDYIGYPISTDTADWQIDRAGASTFTNVGTYQGRTDVLQLSIAPPAGSSSFVNWQGYSQRTSVPAGNSFIGGDLLIQNGWQTGNSVNFVNTGMWGSAMPASVVAGGSYVDASAVFPIVHFSNASGTGRLQVWDTTANPSTGWITLDGTAGTMETSGLINYGSWNSLDMRLITDDGPVRVDYYFNDALIYTWTAPTSNNGGVPEQFWAMYLKARNNGVTSFDTYWSRLLSGQLITPGETTEIGDTDGDLVIEAPSSGDQQQSVEITPNATIDGNLASDGGDAGLVLNVGEGVTIT